MEAFLRLRSEDLLRNMAGGGSENALRSICSCSKTAAGAQKFTSTRRAR